MAVESITGAVSVALSGLWEGTKRAQQFFDRKFKRDITDSKFLDGKRVLYWRYAHPVKQGHYSAFSIEPRYPHQGFEISQAFGIYYVTPDIAKRFRSRLKAFIRRSRRPYLEIGGPVTTFIAPTLEEAKQACKERGKLAKKQAKHPQKYQDSEPPQTHQQFVPVNYRSLIFLFKGAAALKDVETAGMLSFELTSMKSGRHLDPNPGAAIDMNSLTEETWGDWNVMLEAEQGIAWHDDGKNLEWHKVKFWVNLTASDEGDVHNGHIEISGTHPLDMSSPIWAKKKAFMSKTLAAALRNLDLLPSQIAEPLGMTLKEKTKDPKHKSITIKLRDSEAMRMSDGRRLAYGLSFEWKGEYGKTENVYHLPLDPEFHNAKLVNGTADNHDGIVNTERIQNISRRFTSVGPAESMFLVVNKTAKETA